jgi:tripartite-type tricarboxylate transporter receptor subunit TctC
MRKKYVQSKKIFLVLVNYFYLSCFILILILAPTAHVSAFSGGRIVFVVTYSPGGGFDLYSRALAPYLEKHFPGGATVIIKNIPGASSKIGAATMYHAKPDGRTIGLWGIPGLTFGQLFESGKYDLQKVTWLGRITRDVNMVAAGKQSGFKTFKDLQNAEKVRIAASGFSSPNFITPMVVNKKLGINGQFVTGYRGTSGLKVAVMRGDADIFYADSVSLIGQIKSGDLIPIFTYKAEREPELPSIPTIAELGYPELSEGSSLDRVIGGPPNIPEDRVKILEDTLWKALNDPGYIKWAKSVKRSLKPLRAKETRDIVLKSFEDMESVREDFMKFLKK